MLIEQLFKQQASLTFFNLSQSSLVEMINGKIRISSFDKYCKN